MHALKTAAAGPTWWPSRLPDATSDSLAVRSAGCIRTRVMAMRPGTSHDLPSGPHDSLVPKLQKQSKSPAAQREAPGSAGALPHAPGALSDGGTSSSSVCDPAPVGPSPTASSHEHGVPIIPGLDPEEDDAQSLRLEMAMRRSVRWRKDASSPEPSSLDEAEIALERARIRAAIRLIRSPPPSDPPAIQSSSSSSSQGAHSTSAATEATHASNIVELPPGLSRRAHGGRVDGGVDDELAVSVIGPGAAQTAAGGDPGVVNRANHWGDPEGFQEVMHQVTEQQRSFAAGGGEDSVGAAGTS